MLNQIHEVAKIKAKESKVINKYRCEFNETNNMAIVKTIALSKSPKIKHKRVFLETLSISLESYQSKTGFFKSKTKLRKMCPTLNIATTKVDKTTKSGFKEVKIKEIVIVKSNDAKVNKELKEILEYAIVLKLIGVTLNK